MISALESILFAVGEDGLTINDIANILEIEANDVVKLLDILKERYENDENSGLELNLLGNSYKLTTKKENKKYLEALTIETSNNLSNSALETLAIIAYNEPITRLKIEEIRGINSSQMIRNLISKDLIEITGKSELPGRPNLYSTTNRFLDYFGLSSKDELPKIDLEEVEELKEDDLFKTRYNEEE